MNTREAAEQIRSLADGINPTTGEALKPEDACQHPTVLRALFAAANALDRLDAAEQRKRSLPPNTGKQWSAEEERTLCRYFDLGNPVALIARDLGRTRGAVTARLERLGRVAPDPSSTRAEPREDPLALLRSIGEHARAQRIAHRR